jgi:hypothetical protein
MFMQFGLFIYKMKNQFWAELASRAVLVKKKSLWPIMSSF